MSEIYVKCPTTTNTQEIQNECGVNKTLTWSTPGTPELTFYIPFYNQRLISFNFKNITNNGSSVSVDVVYVKAGVEVIAQTYNLGVISTSQLKYHFLDFGPLQEAGGMVYLRFTITGGSTGSLDVELNCTVLVGTKNFCYQSIPSAQRDLCKECQSPVPIYFERSSDYDNNYFSYGVWYSDPQLTVVAPVGYYSVFGQAAPKTVYTFNGTEPSLTYTCVPGDIDCSLSFSKTHDITTYVYNNPYLPKAPNVTISGLKYSTLDYYIKLPNTDNGVVEITISNTQTYQSEVVATITDGNAIGYNTGFITYTYDEPTTVEAFAQTTYSTLHKIPINGSKTIYVAVNGDSNQLTKILRVRVSIGLPKNYNSSANPVISTVSSICQTYRPIYSLPVGLHAYSAYDAINNPRVTTKLYSFSQPSTWTVGTKVWTDGLLWNPAFPYYYGNGEKVFKVGQPFKREFGTKTTYYAKTTLIKQISRLLNLSKKNPVTITKKIEGPKDWQTDLLVPSCIEPIMADIGIIKEVKLTQGLPVPNSYLYLLGYTNTQNQVLSNDSVFIEPNYNGDIITTTGLRHALYKFGGAYIQASKDPGLKRMINKPEFLAASLLGLGAAFDAVNRYFFGGELFKSKPDQTDCPIINSDPKPSTDSNSNSSFDWKYILDIALILIALFFPIKKLFQEICLYFKKVYTDKPYILLENTPYQSTLYSNSGLTQTVPTGYYCDGGYFYTVTNGLVYEKKLSYTNKPTGKLYSITPDNPTFITSFNNFILLPYISGIPVRYVSNTKKKNFTISLNKEANQTIVGELNNPAILNYEIPEGMFEADTQEEADALALDYLNALTAQTQDFYISAEQKPYVSGNTMVFTHEIKVENTPAQWPVFYDNNDNSGIIVGRKLYYDSNGLYTVLNGYYSLNGLDGNYRTFFKTDAGVVVDYYNMVNENDTTVTSPNSGTQPVITTGQTYSSSWYFYGTNYEDTLYDDSNDLHGFTNDWNLSAFYSSQYVKRGMINTPITKSSFYIYNSNTSGIDYSLAVNGWYKEIPGSFNENPFLIQSAFTISLDSNQYCSSDENNGLYVSCVDSLGNPIPSFYGVAGSINIYTAYTYDSTHNFVIEPGQYEFFIPLSQNYIGQITSTDIFISSTNPIQEITFIQGTFNGCVSPTPTPTPVVTPTQTPTPTSASVYQYDLAYSTVDTNTACSDYPTYNTFTYYSYSSSISNGITLYTTNSGGVLSNFAVNGFYSNGTYSWVIDGGVGVLNNQASCISISVTPTNTPTQTPTNTPTQTPTNTPTQTPTNTPTQTPTNTPTQTPTQTSTPGETPTNTPTQTPTQTSTQTPTPTNTCSPDYSLLFGTVCVSCVDYDVYKNTNTCFQGNQYYTPYNSTTYSTNPSTDPCDTSPNYTLFDGILCDNCVNYNVYKNINLCYVGSDQWWANGVGYSSNPSTGYCNETPNYSNNIGILCMDDTNYDVYENTNPCFLGDKYYTDYNGGTTYNSDPRTGPCITHTPTATPPSLYFYDADVYSCSGGACGGYVETIKIAASSTLTTNYYYSNGSASPNPVYKVTGTTTDPGYAVPIVDAGTGNPSCDAVCGGV